MPGGGPGGAPYGPGGGPGGPGGPGGAGLAMPAAAAVSGVPQAWQNWLPSGFAVPHLAQATGNYDSPEGLAATSLRGRRARLTAFGAAVRAIPQFGQKPDATMCIWQLGHTVSA
jgi:hypothetical protein